MEKRFQELQDSILSKLTIAIKKNNITDAKAWSETLKNLEEAIGYNLDHRYGKSS